MSNLKYNYLNTHDDMAYKLCHFLHSLPKSSYNFCVIWGNSNKQYCGKSNFCLTHYE